MSCTARPSRQMLPGDAVPALARTIRRPLARGLQIITVFDGSHRSLTLSEVAIAVDLPRATARRALLTLVALGFVAADGRQFRLTPRVLRLASAYLTSKVVSTLLQPACDRIACDLGESCTN